MEHFMAKGVESIVEVPVLSKTQDDNGRVHAENGMIRFNETVINHGDWYFAVVETLDFVIPFFNYTPVNGNPGMRTGYAHNSYHTIRTWVDSIIRATCQQLLETHPQASLYKPDGTQERDPDEEIMKQAFDLFKQARPVAKDVDGTPRSGKEVDETSRDVFRDQRHQTPDNEASK